MSPRVLVTGASGFVGGHVAASLRESRDAGGGGPEIRLLVRSAPEPSPGPEAVRADPDTPPGPEAVRADLTAPETLRGVCDGVDVVLHCASHVGSDERLTRAVNDHGTRALVAEAVRAGVRRIVYVSTAAVYGRGPFTRAVPADLSPAPTSPTSRARAAAERYVLDAGGVVLRPHLVLGTGDRWVVPGVAALLGALGAPLRDCEARHSFVVVTALAKAVVTVGLAERSTVGLSEGLPDTALTGAHHVNHPRPARTSELLEAISRHLALPLPGAPLTVEEARATLRDQPRLLHHLDMLAVDHWFADDEWWGAAPGTGIGTADVSVASCLGTP
ncbi:NAD-dependent epimerase/dehydratase family protein [Streptomyces sp. NPDC091290]|uniref:NAD-dependent epimerase/dehydratase family protein n=1 Tax=Streptomyces sp. NPDC091290 TaxID=3365990 RepID=UPI0038259B37